MDALLRHFTSAPRLVIWSLAAGMIAVSLAHLVSLSPEPWWLAVCRALPGDAGFGSLFVMWSAMSLAMMLPTAFPMISTYLDIAEAARAKAAEIVAPAILVGGYAAVWLGFSVAAAMLHSFAQGYADVFAAPAFSAFLLIASGLYQFAPVKHACLSKCRRPMPYFMAHWTTSPAGVWRMGLHQGAICLGCCWALMLLGFGAGLMNPAWMAGLTLIMILEKTLPEPKPVIYGLGLGLMGAGAAVMIGAAI